jgi:hypothetical protein
VVTVFDILNEGQGRFVIRAKPLFGYGSKKSKSPASQHLEFKVFRDEVLIAQANTEEYILMSRI